MAKTSALISIPVMHEQNPERWQHSKKLLAERPEIAHLAVEVGCGTNHEGVAA